MWIIFTSLFGVCAAQLMVQAENKVVVLPEAGSQLYTYASLVCYIQPQVGNVRWITPDETNVLSIQPSGQYFITQGDVATISGENKYASILIIEDVSYKNAGFYLCEAMDEDDCSDFPKFAIIELVLKLTLEVPSSKVTVTYNSTESQTVELQCEASGYIRPDSDIRWFKEEEEIGEGVKYNVSFRDGHPHAAQTGHLNETTSSRISVLTIYEVNETDVGTYSCQSLETGEMASLHLNVEVDPATGLNPSTTTPTTTPIPHLGHSTTLPSNSPRVPKFSQSPSTTMDSSSSNSNRDCSISIVAAVLCTFALTATLATFITVVITYLWFKKGHTRRTKSGVSSPDLGSAHPATTHTDVSEQVDMYQISTVTGDKMEGSGGDSTGNTSQ